jgi:hypothetical protein
MNDKKIGIIYEHPLWHEPLFAMLDQLNIAYEKIDLKSDSFKIERSECISLYYNLVSPSAYTRKNQHSISYARSLVRHLEDQGCRVLNGSQSMQLEMSKSAQMSLLHKLEVNYPTSFVFNSVESITQRDINYPQILKPEQGGSGSRIYKVHSHEEVKEIFADNPTIWEPDYLFLIQNEIDYDRAFGIVRLEFLGQELLYAMRIVSHGSFNLCPSVICNPDEGDGHCEIPNAKPPEFYCYSDISPDIVNEAKRIVQESGHDVMSLEFAFNSEGKAVYYDINSNSNLREQVCRDFGSGNPFERVALFLKSFLDQD